MSGNATRGLVLAAVAVIIGALVLAAGFDTPGSTTVVVSDPSDPAPTPTPATDEPAQEIATPTPSTESFDLRPPGDVRVLVANGTDVQGAAGRGKDTLIANGYNALSPVDATSTATASVVYWNPGYEGDAREVARILGGRPDQVQPWPAQVPVLDSADANLLVVLGPDLATSA